MIVAVASLVVFGLASWISITRRQRPLQLRDINRLRRFSERSQREDNLRFD